MPPCTLTTPILFYVFVACLPRRILEICIPSTLALLIRRIIPRMIVPRFSNVCKNSTGMPKCSKFKDTPAPMSPRSPAQKLQARLLSPATPTHHSLPPSQPSRHSTHPPIHPPPLACTHRRPYNLIVFAPENTPPTIWF
jgi:hypothetical protein